MAPSRRLFLAHLAGEPAARALFGRGTDATALAEAVTERRALPLPHREALAAAVTAYQESLHGVPARAVESAKGLSDPAAVVVIAGQQPGVGGGPLLGFVKALGVLALARRLEAMTGGPVVPLWWVASEDHDVDEAGAVLLRGGAGGSELLRDVPRDRTMLSRIAAPVVDLPDVEFRHDTDHLFTPSRGASLGTAAAETFSRLLGGHGLVVVEPHVVRAFSADVFAADVREPGVLAEKVGVGNARLRLEGFENSLASPHGPLHFRVDDDGRRTRGGGTEEDLADLAQRLSADVSLRVLAQDAALPVAVQVAGPSEAEYLAALGPAREHLGVFTPAVAGRPGVTLVDPRLAASMAMFDADVRGVMEHGEEAFHAPVDEGDHPLSSGARRLREDLAEQVRVLKRMPASVRKRAEKAERALDDLAAAADRAREEARGVGASRRRKILDEVLPGGVPQERRWSLLRYVLQHGPGVVDRMAGAIGDGAAVHHVVTIGVDGRKADE